uniref:RanBP2-type domain-containing protein n=1 Tax=Steinernema glaseri TaxID=37863 RepID=A0A1I7ZGB9_9BILA
MHHFHSITAETHSAPAFAFPTAMNSVHPSFIEEVVLQLERNPYRIKEPQEVAKLSSIWGRSTNVATKPEERNRLLPSAPKEPSPSAPSAGFLFSSKAVSKPTATKASSGRPVFFGSSAAPIATPSSTFGLADTTLGLLNIVEGLLNSTNNYAYAEVSKKKPLFGFRNSASSFRSPGRGNKAQPKWYCSNCFIQNDASVEKCRCCRRVKPGAAPSSSSFGGSSNAFGSKLVKPAVTASDSSFKFGFGDSTITNQAAKPESAPSQEPFSAAPSAAFLFGSSTATTATEASSGTSSGFGSSATTSAASSTNFGADLPSTFNFGGPNPQSFQFGAATHASSTAPAVRKVDHARRHRR